MTIKKDIHSIITDKILNLLSNNLKYQRKWILVKNGIASNPYSKINYTGINQLLLSLYIEDGNFQINKWLTFQQASELGGKIIKNEKANPIIYFNYIYSLNKVKLTTKEYNQLSDTQKKQVTTSSFVNYFNVFNVAQIEGLPEEFYKIDDALNVFYPIEELDNLAVNYVDVTKVDLKHVAQQQAFYNPIDDKIIMPLREQFFSSEAYYKTLFHEIAHSTGHNTRLKREGIINLEIDTKKYAFEELVAELTTVYVNARFGIETEISNNTAYIKHWLTHLQNDTKFFFMASAKASKACEFILNTHNFKQTAA